MLDVGGEAGIEPADHTLFQGIQLCRRPVAGDDDLFVGLFQGIEGVEELFLGGFFVPQELDVVDEQHVDAAVFFPEGFQPVVFHALDQLVGEGLAGNVQDLHIRMGGQDLVADGIHQMGLAQAGIAEQEEGVVGVGRVVCNGHGCGLGKPVGVAHHEIVEGVAGRKVGAERPGHLGFVRTLLGRLLRSGRAGSMGAGSGHRICEQIHFHQFLAGHGRASFPIHDGSIIPYGKGVWITAGNKRLQQAPGGKDGVLPSLCSFPQEVIHRCG